MEIQEIIENMKQFVRDDFLGREQLVQHIQALEKLSKQTDTECKPEEHDFEVMQNYASQCTKCGMIIE